MLEQLIAQFPKEYINEYELEGNPLPVVIPCFENKNFFGGCVLNLISIDASCDSVGQEEQITFFKKVYSRFICYETHIWVDTDNFDGDTVSTESVLSDLCSQLSEHGFTYHGKLTTQEISGKVIELHTAFKEKVRDKFGN